MKNLLFLLSLLALVATSGSAQEVPQLSRVYSATFDGLNDAIQWVSLADIDGDHWPEILVTDKTNLILYSTVGDSVLYTVNVDSAMASLGYAAYPDCMPRRPRVLLADVNRDSAADAVLMIGLHWQCWSGDHGPLLLFVDDVLAAEPEVQVLDFYWPSEGGAYVLEAEDFDGDGYPELILSADSADISFYPSPLYYDYHVIGRTRIYNIFPTDITHSSERMLNKWLPVELSDGSRLFATAQYGNQGFIAAGHTTEIEHRAWTLILGYDGSELNRYDQVEPAHCHGDYENTAMNETWVMCTGNIDDRTTAPELLSVFRYRETCEDTVLGVPTLIYDDTRLEIILHQVVAADSLAEVWRVETDECRYLRFYHHPEHAGTFFVMDDCSGELIQCDGQTGEELGNCGQISSTEAPLRIAKPFGDDDVLALGGPYYLITRDSATVAFYSLNEPSAVSDDHGGSVLPDSFTLDQPYPNPFNPAITIPVRITRTGQLTVEVFNALGQRVHVVHEGRIRPGDYEFPWKAKDHASGVYFFHATFDEETRIEKAVLLK
jgi:hypothetical protein